MCMLHVTVSVLSHESSQELNGVLNANNTVEIRQKN